jgi:hypothetical protein
MLKSLPVGYEEIACGLAPQQREESIWVGETSIFGRFGQ